MQLISRFTNRIQEIIWNNIKDYFHKLIVQYPILIRNINNHVEPFQKKILISYLSKGFFTNPEQNSGRTVVLEIFKIVKVFSDLGYSIDLANSNDIKSMELIKDTDYYVIFGFGDVFQIMSEFQPEALTILYMTEQHPEISFKEEQKRIDYFYERHKKHVPMVRSGKFYKLKHLEKRYNYVITLSETEPLIKQYARPYTIFPTGIINKKFVFKDKNHIITRKHFLWLGSTGVIHKGLDLLIEVFNNRQDVNLHICGLDAEARKILKIPNQANIFDYGYIDIKSDTFLEIVEKCSFSILPSCAEGCATSITTSMLHGLIPVVMKNAGFNRLADNAIFLEDYHIEYINSFISKLAWEESESLNYLSKKVFDFARKEFVLSKFEANFKNIIIDIINKND